MVNAASRRHGLNDSKLLLRRVRVKISVQLVRRAVRMIQSCLPRLTSEEVCLLTGVDLEEDDFSVYGDHFEDSDPEG